MFTPQLLFELDKFEHKALFDVELVWKALEQLPHYLNGLPLGQIQGSVDPRAILVNPEQISIGKGSIVEPGAYIQGPCWIGEECQVRHGAYIRGHCLAGNRCVIGHATEVKGAIFLDGAQAGHFAYVGDSIVGNGVNLGAGTKCANLRLDRKPVAIHHRGGVIETGMRKLGALFGDLSQTGCNVVTNPGTIMLKKSLSYACQSVGGIIESAMHQRR